MSAALTLVPGSACDSMLRGVPGRMDDYAVLNGMVSGFAWGSVERRALFGGCCALMGRLWDNAEWARDRGVLLHFGVVS